MSPYTHAALCRSIFSLSYLSDTLDTSTPIKLSWVLDYSGDMRVQCIIKHVFVAVSPKRRLEQEGLQGQNESRLPVTLTQVGN
jgi:hypothetical protein